MADEKKPWENTSQDEEKDESDKDDDPPSIRRSFKLPRNSELSRPPENTNKSIIVPRRTSKPPRKIENESLAAEADKLGKETTEQSRQSTSRPSVTTSVTAPRPSIRKLSIESSIHIKRDATDELWSQLSTQMLGKKKRRKSSVQIRSNTSLPRRSASSIRSTNSSKIDHNYMNDLPPVPSKDMQITPFSRSSTPSTIRTHEVEEDEMSRHGEEIPSRLFVSNNPNYNSRMNSLLPANLTRTRTEDNLEVTRTNPNSDPLDEEKQNSSDNIRTQEITDDPLLLASRKFNIEEHEDGALRQEQEKSRTLLNRSISMERSALRAKEQAENANKTRKQNQRSILSIDSEYDLDSVIEIENEMAQKSIPSSRKIKEANEFKKLPAPKSKPESSSKHDVHVEVSRRPERDSIATVGSLYISEPETKKIMRKSRVEDSPDISDNDTTSNIDADSDAVSVMSELPDNINELVQSKAGNRSSTAVEKGMPVAAYRKQSSRNYEQSGPRVTYTGARQLTLYVPSPRFKFDIEYRHLRQSLDRIGKLPKSQESTDILLAQTNENDVTMIRLTEDQLHNFRFDCLEIHNKFRDLHNVQPLMLEYDMCDHAQQWAEHLAKSNSLRHKKDVVGQNLFLGIGLIFSPYSVVKTWYDEIQYYSFDNPSFTYAAGHFTQLVWKTTKWLGVGICKRGQRVWVVCSYSPPGNMLGTFRENVRPARIITKHLDPKKQQEEFVQNCVQIHNELRSRHRVPPLILSPSISSHAMEWAQELAAIGTMKYRPGGRYGENLYAATNFEPTAEDVVKSWYSEIFAYNFKQPGFNTNAGNFTQLVWKRTMEIGVGISKYGSSTIVVCNYNPPGNYSGGFVENVLEPKQRDNKQKLIYHSKVPNDELIEYENNLPIEDQILLSHNRYRSYHGCPPLTLNEDLNAMATEWAKYLMETNVFKYRPNNKFGENIFYSSGLNVNGETCVRAWYIEIKKYNTKKPAFSESTRNFTQMVWKDTKEMGIGVAFRDRYTYIVCNYHPCGNIPGDFEENVPNLISVSDSPYANMDKQGQKMRGYNVDGTRYRIVPTGDTFEEQCLNAHNRYRALHNAPALTLNPDLNRYANEWAKHIAKMNSMTHRANNKYGENLYFATGFKVTGEDPVAAWYNEVEEYDFGKPGFHTRTGHFTQVIWHNTEELGVGIYTENSKSFVVCNYYPHGNVINTFKENVLPPPSLKSISETFLNSEDQTFMDEEAVEREEESEEDFNVREFERICLLAHNKFRSLHGCPSLRLSRTLCRFAEEWAKRLSLSQRLYHRPNCTYGENLYMASGFQVTGQDPVQTWYNEIHGYNFKKPKFKRETANFSQMIWRFSESLGVGVVRRDNATFVVCNYHPYGNINEKFSANVPRPLDMAPNDFRVPDSLQLLNGPIDDKVRELVANRILKLHNAYRMRHTCPPLELKENLNESAQEWANYLASNNRLEHRPQNKNGANIFKSNGWHITLDDIMRIWYNEIKYFNFDAPELNSNTSNFTQIIWLNSEFLGVGVANDGKSVWLVCNYDPPGNFPDEVKFNIPEPI